MGILGLSAIYNVATGLMDAGQSQENVVEGIAAAPSRGPGWGSTGP